MESMSLPTNPAPAQVRTPGLSRAGWNDRTHRRCGARRRVRKGRRLGGGTLSADERYGLFPNDGLRIVRVTPRRR